MVYAKIHCKILKCDYQLLNQIQINSEGAVTRDIAQQERFMKLT